ncbi:MAG: hypothetical protein JWR09_464, partial [Mucilaginibacter sp.]|nr:hypothetical protein [Mucilaginibacter sp.]
MIKDELDKGIAEESSKSLVQLALSIFKGIKKKAL